MFGTCFVYAYRGNNRRWPREERGAVVGRTFISVEGRLRGGLGGSHFRRAVKIVCATTSLTVHCRRSVSSTVVTKLLRSYKGCNSIRRRIREYRGRNVLLARSRLRVPTLIRTGLKTCFTRGRCNIVSGNILDTVA